MLYKFHDYKFEKIANRYYSIIRSAMNNLGHSEVAEDNPADFHFYNHTTTDIKKVFIVKPTAPTSRHFAIDSMGYANSSALSFTKPDINNDMDWNSVEELRNTKPNKWDDSILLKWKVVLKAFLWNSSVSANVPSKSKMRAFNVSAAKTIILNFKINAISLIRGA